MKIRSPSFSGYVPTIKTYHTLRSTLSGPHSQVYTLRSTLSGPHSQVYTLNSTPTPLRASEIF